MARAQMSMGDFAASRKTIAEYRQYVSDTTLGARDNNKLTVRKAALAAAAYNEVQMAYFEARGNSAFKLERNLENYASATKTVEAFISNYATEGAVYIPGVLAYLGRLYVDTGALTKAEQAYNQLKVKDPARASRLASEIFQEYQNLVKSQIAEVEKAITAGKTDNELTKAKGEVANARERLTALGTDYINGSDVAWTNSFHANGQGDADPDAFFKEVMIGRFVLSAEQYRSCSRFEIDATGSSNRQISQSQCRQRPCTECT